VNDFRLNLPANISAFAPGSVRHDLVNQVEYLNAAAWSLASKCHERTGEALAYMGMINILMGIITLTDELLAGRYGSCCS
jgi:hypothetical protein